MLTVIKSSFLVILAGADLAKRAKSFPVLARGGILYRWSCYRSSFSRRCCWPAHCYGAWYQ
jgi:hypothetical protein